jgi:exodeoxyribonuclease-5
MPQQEKAIKLAVDWRKNYQKNPQSTSQIFRLFGYAGSGKTTLAKIIAQEIKGNVLFAAYTGKAAVMMQSKGCTNASTIHSLIYKPIEDENGIVHFELNNESLLETAKLIIIDECSMVGSDLANDLLCFGVPILVLGDPAQLPPIATEGYFTKNAPDFMLTEIHRQARENPIIAMSMLVRNEKQLPVGKYGTSSVISSKKFNADHIEDFEQVLCGLNKTRILINNQIRENKSLPLNVPAVGDKLICLKNKRQSGLLNGSLWEVLEVAKRYAHATLMIVKSIDSGVKANPIKIYVHDSYFIGNEQTLDWKDAKQYNPFTFGYGITVHKSQGSQWNDVLLFDESDVFKEDKWKHLYTGITRAAEKITLVV